MLEGVAPVVMLELLSCAFPVLLLSCDAAAFPVLLLSCDDVGEADEL